MPDRSDKSAFEALFRTEYAGLVAASQRLCTDRALAEDVVQNVFMRFYERGGLRRAENPTAYLRRAVVTRTLNAIRDRKRLDYPGDEAIASATQHSVEEESHDLAAIKKRLHTAIAGLPERARIILTLHRFEGLSYKEIAAELDIAPKTVENQLARALKLLRVSLHAALLALSHLNLLDV